MLTQDLQKPVTIVKQNFLKGYSAEVHYRYNKLESWKELQDQNCDDLAMYKALQVSRATLFRWQKYYAEDGLTGLESVCKKPHKIRDAIEQKRIKDFVLQARKKYPIYGKAKIKVMLEKEKGVKASVTTIGRIITKSIKQGLIKHVGDICGTRIRVNRRKFDDHAQRFQFGMKAKELGEMIQIDHMTVAEYKHFAAICPISKLLFAYAYTKATAFTAADFLQKLILFFPFKISSIQVDGGSEFMADFEQACKNQNIPLFVLPPRSPKLNGTVERSNRTFRYEFYTFQSSFKNVLTLNEELAKFSKFYREERPHQHLNYLTPMEYLNSRGVKNANI